MIVAVVAEKGGVGKTVVATNLAGMRAAAGFRALLLDVDTQASSTFWTQFRSERSLPQVETQAHRGEAFRRYVNAPRALHDDIVIDVGAGDGPSLDTALQGADCAVIPVRPTGVDMYTMQLMDHRVAEARELNPRLRALALINQASTNPRHRGLGVAIESLREGSRNLTVADTVLRDRVAYQRSHTLGQTVLEYVPRSDRGVEEMLSLYREVFCEDYPCADSKLTAESARA
jgi:chromosome partitioning protein